MRTTIAITLAACTAVGALGCGAPARPSAPVARATPADAGGEDAAADADPIEVPLGCDSIRRSDVERELATALHRAAARAGGADTVDRDALRAQVVAEMVRRRIVAREARWLGAQVSESMIDDAERTVRESQGLDEMGLVAALGAQGMTEAEYRDALRESLLEAWVVGRGVIAHADDAAIARRLSDEPIDPDDPAALDEARAAARQHALEESWDERARRIEARLARMETRIENGRCVEPSARVRVDELQFEGTRALDPAALREALAPVAGADGKIEVGVLGELPPDALARLQAAYFELGFVEVVVESELADGGVVVRVQEGAAFRIGRVEVVVRGADGRETPSTMVGHAPATGAPFVRGELVRWRSELEELHRRAGLEVTDVDPDTHVDDAHGIVDLRMIVRVAARI